MSPRPIPAWLAAVPRNATSIDVDDFFSSRVVFYPGSGNDGHPLRVFASSHEACSFLYVDYLVDRDELVRTVEGKGRGYSAPALGYHLHARVDVDVERIVPADFESRVSCRRHCTGAGFAFVAVLERDHHRGDDHGPERLAILFVSRDAFDVYEAAFVQKDRAPYAIVLQDHGFGGNHDRFGGGGRLERLATDTARPPFLVVGANTRPWDGYVMSGDCGRGGMHQRMPRMRFRRALPPRAVRVRVRPAR